MVKEQWEAYKETEKMKWELNLSPACSRFLSEMEMNKAVLSGGLLVCEMHYQNKHFRFTSVGRRSIFVKTEYHNLTFNYEEIQCIKEVMYKFGELCIEREEE